MLQAMTVTAPVRRARPARRARHLAAVALAALALSAPLVAPSPASAEPACPVDGANARFVRFVYLEVLNRCPDKAGAAHWTAALDAGMDRWAFAEAIDTSTENLVTENVVPLYQGLLGRAPTDAERDAWVAWMRREHQNAVPTAALLSSPEAYDARTSGTTAERDRQWLTIAYNRILDRAPDPSGLDWWAARLAAAGSTPHARIRVAMTFEHSGSNARSWVRAAMAGALGRPADPAGQAYWTAWLTGPGRWRTFQLWTHQLASDEAYRRAQALPD
jgi:hypothetical protein